MAWFVRGIMGLMVGVLCWCELALGQGTAPSRPRPTTRPAPAAQGARPVEGERTASRPRPPAAPEAEKGRPAEKPAAAAPARGPFKLTAEEEAELDRVLQLWEQRSAKIKKLKADFTRWEYDPVFGKRDEENNLIASEHHGKMHYSAPDKGAYEITDDEGEHWVCDGKSVFEYNVPKKQIIERPLPTELQGKAISDGPLPFLFGASAAKQKQRYFLRISTPERIQGQGQIWIEAWPRYSGDAANFQRATVILDQRDMLPYAIEIILPNGKNRTVHQFANRVVNPLLDAGFWTRDPFSPRVPSGWTKVVAEVADPDAPQAPPAERAGPPGNPRVEPPAAASRPRTVPNGRPR